MGHEYVELKNTSAAIEAYRKAVDILFFLLLGVIGSMGWAPFVSFIFILLYVLLYI